MMRPTVRQLEYVVAVAEHLHFSRAAEACAISQPALSAQIQQLEELYGVQLFERDRRKVLVTDAGREIIERARAILTEIDALADAAHCADEPLVGRTMLGVIPTVAPYLLPKLLPRLREQYPKLQLVLREDQTIRLLAQLAEGKLDVLLLALPVEAAFVAELPLFDESFLVALPAAHSLAGKKHISESDLRDQVVLLLDDGHCLRDHALSVCNAAGARESEQVRATSLGTLAHMVAHGLGITLLPEMAVGVESAAAEGLVVRPFSKPAPGRKIGLVWRD